MIPISAPSSDARSASGISIAQSPDELEDAALPEAELPELELPEVELPEPDDALLVSLDDEPPSPDEDDDFEPPDARLSVL